MPLNTLQSPSPKAGTVKETRRMLHGFQLQGVVEWEFHTTQWQTQRKSKYVGSLLIEKDLTKLIRGCAFTSSSLDRPDSGRCSRGGAAWEKYPGCLTLEWSGGGGVVATSRHEWPRDLGRGSGADLSSSLLESYMHGYKHPGTQNCFNFIFFKKWQAMIEYILKVESPIVGVMIQFNK